MYIIWWKANCVCAINVRHQMKIITLARARTQTTINDVAINHTACMRLLVLYLIHIVPYSISEYNHFFDFYLVFLLFHFQIIYKKKSRCQILLTRYWLWRNTQMCRHKYISYTCELFANQYEQKRTRETRI